MSTSLPVRRPLPALALRRSGLRPISLAACLVAGTPIAFGLPQGALPTFGQTLVKQTNAQRIDITQTSQRAGLDWTSFSIGSNERVVVSQPDRSSVLLNRVVGNDPSQIFGSLQANGTVWLINPRGIIFGAGSQVDVGGLLASTLSIRQEDVASGRLLLSRSTGDAGEIRVEGQINAPGGSVVLVAPNLTQTGQISAARIGLAAATEVQVDVEGDGLIFFNARNDSGLATRLSQLGTLQANGGSVELRAAARAGFADTVLNLEGVVQARSIGRRAGRVVIDGGGDGVTLVSGTVDVSGSAAGEKGGEIVLLGQKIGLTATALLDASGAVGGGGIRVGGDFQGKNPGLHNAEMVTVLGGARLLADANAAGDGGTVVLWSDKATRFGGDISARGGALGGDGGFVEVSGKDVLRFAGRVDLSAPMGKLGTLLLDPADLEIVNGAGNADLNGNGVLGDDIGALPVVLGAATVLFTDPGVSSKISSAGLVTQLSLGSVVLQATNDITVSDAVTSAQGGSTLTLTARNNVNVNAALNISAGITLRADDNATGGGRVLIAAPVTSADTVTLSSGGSGLANSVTALVTAPSLAITNGATTLGASNLLASTTAVSVASGASLSMAAFTNTVASLALAGTLGGTGKLTAASYAVNGGTVTANLGTGALTSTLVSALNGSADVSSVAVNGGTLSLGAANRFTASPAVTLAATATLALGGAETFGSLTGAATSTLALGANTLSTGAGGNSSFTGVISGTASGGITKLGAITVFTLNGATASTYGGATRVQEGGLTTTATNLLPTGTAVAVDTGATLTLGGANTVASLALSGTLAGASTLTAASYTLTNGNVAAGASLGAGTFTSSGASNLGGTVAAATVNVTGGSLSLGAADLLDNAAAVTVATGTTLTLGGNDTVGSLALAGTLGGAGKLTAASYAINGGTVTANLGTGALSSTLASALNGTADVSSVVVNSGTLALGSAGRLTTGPSLNIAAAATLQTGGAETVGAITLAGTLSGSGTLSANSLLATGVTGLINNIVALAGAGNVTVDPAATLTVGNGAATGSLSFGTGSFSLGVGSLLSFNRTGSVSLGDIGGTGGTLQVLGGAAYTLAGSAPAVVAVQVSGGTTSLILGDGSGTRINDAASVAVQSGATLTVGNTAETIGSLSLRGTVGGASTLIATGGYTLQAGGTNTVNTALGAGTLTVLGNTTLNAAVGSTVVNVTTGTLSTTANSQLSSGAAVTVGSGAGLTLGGNEAVTSLSLAGTLGGGAGFTITPSTSTTLLGGADVSALIGGTVAINSSGAVVLNQPVASTTVNVNGGTLTLGAPNLLANTAAVTVASVATLAMGANNASVGTLALAGILNGTGKLTATSYALDGGIVNAKLGTGGLTSLGVSQLNNTADVGTLAVNSGTLTLNAAGRLTDSAMTITAVASGATLALGGNETVGSVNLAGTLGGAGRLTASDLATTGAAALITSDLTLALAGNAVVAAAGTLTVGNGAGSGTLTLDTGQVSLGNAGTLAYSRTGAVSVAKVVGLGATSTLQVAGGGSFNLGSVANVTAVQVAGAGTSLVLANGSGSRIADAADVTVTGGATFTLGDTAETVQSLSLRGTLNGAATLIATNGYTMATGGTNVVGTALGAGTLTVQGDTTLNAAVASTPVNVTAGTLTTTANNRLAAGAAVTVSSGAGLTLGGNEANIASLTLAGTLAGGATRTLTASSGATLQDGAVVNAHLGGAAAINSSGAVALNETTASATLNVNGGTLTLTGVNRFTASPAVTLAAAATLALGGAETFGSLTGAATSTLALGANTLSTGAGATSSFTGVFTGTAAGGITKLGTATVFTLDGSTASSYGGVTRVQEGGLTTTAANLLPTGSAVTVDTNATLTLGGANTVGSLALSGTLAGTATLSAASYTLSGGSVAAGASLGAGVLNSSGVSSLAGTAAATTVHVTGGTLSLASAARLVNSGAAVTIDSAATLQLAGAETVTSLTSAGILAGVGQTLTATTFSTLQTGAAINANLAGATLNVTGNANLAGTAAATTVNISGGILTTASAGRLASGAALTVGSGAALALGGDETVTTATLAGSLSGAGKTLTATTTTTLQTGAVVSANLGGLGTLEVTGAASLTGTAGTNTVNLRAAGNLTLGSAERLPDTATLNFTPGGHLTLTGNETVANVLGSAAVSGVGTLITGTIALNNSTVSTALTTNTLTSDGASSLTAAVTVNGSSTVGTGVLTVGDGSTNGAIQGPGTLSVASGAVLAFNRNDSVSLGTVGGSGTLRQAGTGNLQLNGVVAAQTVQVNSGTVTLGASDRLDSGAAVSVLTGATLAMGANTNTVASLTLAGTLGGTGTLTAGTYALNGGLAAANLGAGTLTSTLASTLTGTSAATTVNLNSGTLTLSSAGRLTGNPAVVGLSSAGLALGGNGNEAIASLTLAGPLTGGALRTLTVSGSTTLQSGAVVSAALPGTGAIDSSGTVAINQPVGATGFNVNGGTLTLGAADLLANTAIVTVATGATLALGGTDTVGSLTLRGSLAGAGTLTAASYALESGSTVSGANLGGGALSSGGVSALGGTAAAGSVAVNDGSLTLGSANRLTGTPALNIAAAAATLALGGNETVGGVSLAGTLGGTGTLTATSLATSGASALISSGLSLSGAGNAVVVSGATLTIGSGGATGVLTLGTGQVQLGAASVLSYNRTGTVAIGDIAGTAGRLQLAGGAAYTLNGVASNVTAVSVSGSSTGLLLANGSANRINDSADVTVAAGATLTLGNSNEIVNSLSLRGTLAGSNTLTATNGSTLAAGGSNVVNANLGGALLTVQGNSTLAGTAAATTVNITAGTLTTTGNARLAAGAGLTLSNGAGLTLGGNESIAGATLAGTLGGGSARVLSATGGFTLQDGAAINAQLGGTAAINSTGNVSLNQAAAAGTVNVITGTLTLGAPDLLANNAAVTVLAGAALALGGNSDTVGSLALAGSLSGTGTLTANTYALTGGTADANLGAGTLTSTGLSALGGTAAATSVAVNAGTLTLGAANRLAAGATVTVASGATLTMTGSNTIDTLALAGRLDGSGTLSATAITGYNLNGGTASAALGLGTLTSNADSILNSPAAAGTVNVVTGSLTLGGSGLLTNSPAVTVNSGAALALGANTATAGTLALAGSLNGTGTLEAGSYALNNGSTVNANLGAGTLATTGAVALNGTTGATSITVNAGSTLTLGATNRLADAAAVTVAATGMLALGGSDTIANLALAGTVNGSGTLTATNYTLTAGTVNANLGTGTIISTGASALNNTSAATALTVSGGTLTLGAANRLTDAAVATVQTGATLALGGAETIGSLTGGGTLTLGGGTLSTGAAGSTSFTGAINGGGGITKQGAGTVFTLSSNQGYLGTTQVDGGTLLINGTLASTALQINSGGVATLGSADRLANTATVTVANGGTLNLGGADTVGSLALSGSLAGSGTLTGTTYSLAGGSTGASANLGAGALTSTGSSTLAGSAAASTVAVNSGTLTLAAANRLASTAAVTVASAGSVVMTANQTIGSLAGAGTVDLASFTLATGGQASSSFSGGLIGTGGLIKQGAATTFTLGGVNGYTGATQVDAGTLAVSATGTLASTPIAVNANSTLTLGGANRLADGAAVTVVSTGTLTLGGDDTVASLALAGTLNGSGTLTAASYALTGGSTALGANLGAGALTSNGTSNLGGRSDAVTVAVNSGTLALGSADRLADNAAVTVASLATLTLGGTDSVGSLALAGTLNGSGTLTAATYALTSGSTSVNAGLGAGALTSTGTSSLAGTSGAGSVAVSSGTLTLGSLNRLADTAAVTVANAATLSLNGTDTVGSLALSGTLGGTGKLTAASYALTGGNTTVNALLGAGSLTASGTSTLAGTSDANTVQVTSGTLVLGSANRLSDTAAVTVDSGATLQLTGNDTVASLSLAGTLSGSGVLSAGNYDLNNGVYNLDIGGGILNSHGTSLLNGSSLATTVNVLDGALTLGAPGRFLATPALNIVASARLNLGGAETVNSLAGGGTLDLGAATLTTLAKDIIGSPASTSFSGAITGTGGLTKQGLGRFTLSGVNGYTGRTQVDAGTLTVSGTLASGTVVVNNAGALELIGIDRLINTADVSVTGGASLTLWGNELLTLPGTDTVASLALSGTLNGSGTLTAASYSLTSGNTTALANLGSGALTSTGNSTLAGLAAASTVAVNSGTLVLAAADRLTALPAVTVASAATLRIGAAQTIGSLSGSGLVDLASFTLSTGGGGSSSFAGGISGISGTGGTGGLRKQGAATTFTLDAANGYTAATNVDAGNLVLSATGTLASTAVNVNAGGTLTLAAANRLADGAAVTVAGTGTLTLGGTDTVASLNLSGSLNGVGTLTAATYALNGGSTALGADLGAGALTSTGSSSLAGTAAASSVTVNSGTLTLAAANRLADNAAVSVATAATLTLNGTDRVGTLALAGTLNGSGTLTAASYALNSGSTTASAGLGAGDLTSTGTSTLAGLSATSSVVVNSGTLVLASADRLSALPATSVAGAATLTLAGDQTLGKLDGAGTVALGAFTLATGAGGTSNFAGVISGSGGLTKQGAASTFTLSGANVFTGATTVDAGTLALASANRLADGSAVTVKTGAVLTLAGDDTVAGLALAGTLGGNGTLTATSYALNSGTTAATANLGAGTLTSAGASTLNGSAAASSVTVNSGALSLGAANRLADSATVTVASGATLNLSGSDSVGHLILAGNLTGTGVLTALDYSLAAGQVNLDIGAGTLTSSGASVLNRQSAAGAVSVTDGSLTLASAGRFTSSPGVTVAGPAILALGGNETLGSLAGAGKVQLAGFTLAAGAAGNSEFSGQIAGSGGLVKQGSASNFTLSGANSYTGATRVDAGTLTVAGTLASPSLTVNAGSLVLTASDRLANNAAVAVASSATLTLAGDDSIGSLALTGTLNGAGTLTAASYALSSGVSTANANLGAGALSSAGASQLAGRAAADSVSVTSGSLTLASAGRLTAVPSLAVASGASLVMGGNETASSLLLRGILAGTGTLTAANYHLDDGSTVVGTQLGAGALVSDGISSLGGTANVGPLSVATGVLTLGSAHRLTATPATSVAAGTSLVLGGDETLGTLAGSGAVALGGATLSTGLGGSSSFDGQIGGSGGLVKQGSGSFSLGGVNAYTGATLIAAGTLVLPTADRLADSSAVTVSPGATLRISATETVGSLTLAGTLAGGGTLTAPTYALDNAIIDGQLGVGSLVATGNSVLNGSAAVGSARVDAGTLTLGSAGRFTAKPDVTVASGATLALGGPETLGTLSGGGTLALGAATLATGATGSSTFAGIVSGSGGLTKQGAASVFTLSGANTFSGATTVEAGTLALASANRLADASAVTVKTGASLILAGDDTVASLALAGTLGGVGTLSAATYALDSGSANANLGAGALTSTGTSTLAGSAGASSVDVTGGRLTLASANRLSDTSVVSVASPARLTLTGDDKVGRLDLRGTIDGTGTLSATQYNLTNGTVLAQLGSGSLRSSGASQINGTAAVDALQVDDGILSLGSANRLLALAAVTVANGARLVLGGDDRLGSLTGAGSLGLGAFTLTTGSAGSTTFSGVMDGSGGIVKRGAATTFTLAGANSYTGITRVAEGTLTLGDGANHGSLASSALVVDGLLRSQRSDDVVFAAPISGSGGVEQAGGGTLTMQGGNKTYSGATTVASGKLATTASENLSDVSAVSVATDAQLVLGGAETVKSLDASGKVVIASSLTTTGAMALKGAVTAIAGAQVTLTATQIDAVNDGNAWGSSLAINASGALNLSAGKTGADFKDLTLGAFSVGGGGRVDAGKLVLGGVTRVSGANALVFDASGAAILVVPDLASGLIGKITPANTPIAFTADVVTQTADSRIEVASGGLLSIVASKGGSVNLSTDSNQFVGGLAVRSGGQAGKAWSANLTPDGATSYSLQNRIRVSGGQVNVGGAGFEADVVSIKADVLTTLGAAVIVARLPYDNLVGAADSLPGLSLELTPASFLTNFPFGQGTSELAINVGAVAFGARDTLKVDSGFVTVSPRGGAKGSTAVFLKGPLVAGSYGFFYDGAGQQTEVPVFYNGVSTVTPQVSGSISSTVSVSESARKERFEEAVRTENVAVRLRAGVIAEVGPGTPATVSTEPLDKMRPEVCPPAGSTLGCAPNP